MLQQLVIGERVECGMIHGPDSALDVDSRGLDDLLELLPARVVEAAQIGRELHIASRLVA